MNCRMPLLAGAVLALVAGGASGQFDPEFDQPPSTSRYVQVPPPTISQPYEVAIFPKCWFDDQGVTYDPGTMGVEITSMNVSVGMRWTSIDTLVTITLTPYPAGKNRQPLLFPRGTFTLWVITGHDTATFLVHNHDTFAVEVMQETPLLAYLPAKFVPDTLLFMECANRKSAVGTLDALRERFTGKYQIVALDEGFYPCLPSSRVQRTRLSRKGPVVNRTDAGYLLAFSTANSAVRRELAAWVSTFEGK